MKEHFVKRGNIRLCTQGFGNTNDPAILLIMGATASMLWWEEAFCRQLADQGYYVIRFDNRDTGKSTTYPAGTPPYQLEDMVDDLMAILDAYQIDKVHLAGMSLGGLLCQITALRYPERVASLTLIATGPFGGSDPTIPEMDKRIIAFQSEAVGINWSNEQEVVAYLVKGNELLSGSKQKYDRIAGEKLARAEFERASSFQSIYNHAQLSGGEAYYDKVNKIIHPALIIHGTADKIWHYKNAFSLQQQLQQSSLVTLDGTGHELHRSDWKTIIVSIAQHIESI